MPRFKNAFVCVVLSLGVLWGHQALASTIVFTDRLQWETAVASTFTEETFNAIVSDQTFNNGATLDFAAFMLTGTGNADLFDSLPVPNAPTNIVDAFPFGAPGSPNGTTYLKARVCEGASCETAFFTIDFADPQTAWGADWGPVGSLVSFFISADGVLVGQAQPGFWGFVSTDPFSRVTIDTCAMCNGASTQIDNFVFSAVPEPATPALLCTAATAYATMRRRRRQAREPAITLDQGR